MDFLFNLDTSIESQIGYLALPLIIRLQALKILRRVTDFYFSCFAVPYGDVSVDELSPELCTGRDLC